MTKTCGDCKHYGNNSCYSPKAALSLLDDVFTTTPACEHFEPRDLVQLQTTAPEPRKTPLYRDPLDMLSEETRSKLNRPPRRWQEG